MKLDRIVLENFGVYARQKFQFDCAPLVLQQTRAAHATASQRFG